MKSNQFILIYLCTIFYFIFEIYAKYSCRNVSDCIVECLNIPQNFIYNLKNISSDWFPVLQDDGNCYLHNSLTGENL